MFDESSQCTIVLPEECLGYGLVVPFLAYRFASLVSHKNSLNREACCVAISYAPRAVDCVHALVLALAQSGIVNISFRDRELRSIQGSWSTYP